MANDEPAVGGLPEEPGAPWLHDWYSYDQYRNVHESYMERLAQQGVVLESNLSFIEVSDHTGLSRVNLTGDIICADGVSVSVEKTLMVLKPANRRPLVKGRFYSYHAWLRDEAEGDLIRYDNADGEDDLHRHDFDPRTGAETARTSIDISELPTLGAFIPQAVELGRRARELRNE